MAKRYYFLGIGGISMSSLAIMLKKMGHRVCGSDEKCDHSTEILAEEGIKVIQGTDNQGMEKADVVVYSSAIKPDNPQFQLARKIGKKMMQRGELLGQISRNYKNIIAVAGSHGKTTTTAMIFEILKKAGLRPTLHLGGYRIEDNKNFVLDGDDFFVTEACEYCDNFLFLEPTIAVVTNVEKEHMDYFGTFENQLKSFEKFKSQSKIVVDNLDGLTCKNAGHDEDGRLFFDIYQNNKKIIHLHLQICEDVNTQNCLYAYKVAKVLGIDDSVIKDALEGFAGVKTRFERVSSPFFKKVICDYAHHPTEIKNAVASAQKIYGEESVVVIFQPHTYSRTRALLDEFVKVFENIKNPIIFKTYSAREKEEDGVSAKQFAQVLKNKKKKAFYADSYEELFSRLSTIDKNFTLLFVGAGDLPQLLHKNGFLS